jgi:hypothetical protein
VQRLLLTTALIFAACGPSASRQPTTVTITTDDNLVCADEVSPSTGMTHRVCHAPVTITSAAPAGNQDELICTDETPTGTNLTKRICRSQVEIDHDRKLAGDIWLHQGSRVGCNPETMECPKGPGL